MLVKVIKACRAEFQKYGQIVIVPEVPALLGTQEIRFWPCLAKYHIEGETEVGICRCFERPRRIESLERHKETPEILMPVDGDFFLPVAPADQPAGAGRLRAENVQVFHIPSGAAVILERGVWHWAAWPDGKESITYQVIFKLGTPADDCEKKDIVKPVEF